MINAFRTYPWGPGSGPGLGEPGAWTWQLLPWEEDLWAQEFVQQHPCGATLEEIGEALGVSMQRVRQIEEKALRKLRRTVSGRSPLSMHSALSEWEVR